LTGVKTPVMEIVVQGPQSNAIVEALEKRGVKKTFVVVEDKRK
jgi:translation initiation factor 2D